jgi:hypothetical protein
MAEKSNNEATSSSGRRGPKRNRSVKTKSNSSNKEDDDSTNYTITSEDLVHMMNMLKHWVTVSDTYREKINWLTLVPEPWSIERTVDHFEITTEMALTAKFVRTKYGVFKYPPDED